MPQSESSGTADQLRRQNAAIAEFGLAAFRNTNLDQLLTEAATLISSALDTRYVKVLELLPGRQELLVRAGVNWKPGVVGHAKIGADSHSPGGYALQTNEPVVSQDLSSETRFRIPQLLIDHGVQSMVNVIIAGDGAPFGVLEVDSRHPRQFDADHITFLHNYANLIAAVIDRLRTHQALAQAADDNKLLMQELRHRVKNALALASSLASQTATKGRTAEEFRDAVLGRLQAMARAESLAFEQQEHLVDLAQVVERVLEPHRADRPDAVLIDGASAPIQTDKARTFGLVLHELATNAAKYGALSVAGGQAHVSWSLDGGSPRTVRFLWQESGGPKVEPPKSRGFGSRMIEQASPFELGGEVELSYPPQGVRCVLTFPAE